MLFTFSVLAQKHHFWANQVKNIKIFTLSQTLILKLIRRCRLQWYCHLCLFQTGNTLFGRFWSKNSKMSILAEFWYLGQFKYTKFNGAVHFFGLRQETIFGRKFGPANQNCQIKLKFGTQTNSNIQNSLMLFTFSVLDWKHPFWPNLVQNVKRRLID